MLKTLRLLLPALLLVASCAEPDYFPDNVGNTWSFTSDDSMHRAIWNFCGWGFTGMDTTAAQLFAMGRDTFGFVKTKDSVFLTGSLLSRTKLRTVLLRLPLRAGDTWVAVPPLPPPPAPAGMPARPPDSSLGWFEGFEDVVSPVGRFRRCARVAYRGPAQNTRIWFCPGKGPVQIASRNPYGQDSALSTKILRLVDMKLTRDRPVRPGPAELAELRVRFRERHVFRGMRVIQRVMESYGQDHAGNFPSPRVSWARGDTAGIAVLLPGGDQGRAFGHAVAGTFPWNPFTGEDYEFGKDLFYYPDTLPAPGRNAVALARDSLCPFRDLRPAEGVDGTIVVLGYTPPRARDAMASEYAIIGFGRADAEPILEADTTARPEPQNRRYLVIHNP